MLRNPAIVAILTLSASVAMGDVLTFDDLPAAGSSLLPVPGGYGGLDWDEFRYMNPSVFSPGSGYENCMVSAPHVVYNNFARVATAGGSVFDFYLAYLGAAWNMGLNIEVEGYLGGDLLYSQTVVVDCYGPAVFVFDYQGIDLLTFESFGGQQGGLGNSGQHFVLDNMMINEVPEPATMALLGLGVLGLVTKRRKK